MKFWQCRHTWKKSAKNTLVCLLGCAIGDNAVILWFQFYGSPSSSLVLVMILAMLAGLCTSMGLETLILLKQMSLIRAIKVAFGMSIISMLMMEAAANLASILFTRGNRLALSFVYILPAWLIGYVVAWVYNYFQLKKHGKSCHG